MSVPAPVLRIQGLRKSFRTPDGETQPILELDSFELAPGEQVALAGASGTGKTTLLHVIAGILTADAGAIELAGADLARLSESARDRHRALHLGYVFQTFLLLQGYSALENVLLAQLFGAGADDARARALLERVGLGPRMHYRPAQLSVGQQQRVAVARALAGKPSLVLADEPTGNLDPARAKEALALLCDTCREQGAALLVVSHDRDVLASFARVHDLAELNRAGRTAATGTRA
ncbi:MAG: ABC transporter ATP-binding protein [Planctomycetota bacterium]|nr:MAG: ABC transporter ATP-binding protein [Planctomycetota bacterium]